MTHYTVHQLAELSGVSVRTLHHYDEIGLLCPNRAPNGYRTYTETELLRLQQILFFRELDFSLEEITQILTKSGFDLSAELKNHRVRIGEKKDRLDRLLHTIDETLLKVSGKKDMTDDALFDAFMEKHEKEYAAEAEGRWGNSPAFRQSQERMRKYTKEDLRRLAKQGEELTEKIAEVMHTGPASAKTQKLISQHYEHLRAFYDPSPEIYRGLAQMYVEDAHFRAYYEKYDPALPEFMRDAMMVFCKK